MKTFVDYINISLSALLHGEVQNTVWAEKYISYDHLVVFGCMVFIPILRGERFKLDKILKQCGFEGYGREEFDYRLWDLFGNKWMISQIS